MPFTYINICIPSAAASVGISAQEVVELVYTTVTKEWPPSAYLLATLHVDIHNLDARLRPRLGKDLALRPCNETVAPELYAARSAARVILVAAAVYRHDGKAVCDGMAALHRHASSCRLCSCSVSLLSQPMAVGYINISAPCSAIRRAPSGYH